MIEADDKNDCVCVGIVKEQKEEKNIDVVP
jgi:hypothetical protein